MMTTDNERELEQLVDLVEAGHELTDDEAGLLSADSEARQVFRDLTILADGVRLSACRPDVDRAWADFEARHARPAATARLRRWLWPAVAAAVVALLVAVWWSRGSLGWGTPYIAYERQDQPDGVFLTKGGGAAIELTGTEGQPSVAVRQTNGQLVLDYQAMLDEGYAVSDQVESHTVTMPTGKDFKLVLADGTEVWLHAGSRLTYPSHFVGQERRVYLSGEAYLRVAHDEQHPFIVYTDEMEARVLGTELDMKCRQGEASHVALVTGSVEVSSKTGGEPVVLHPGQRATLAAGGALAVSDEDMSTFVYWRDGYLYYDDVQLAEVARSLGRWFNVGVVVEDGKNVDMHIRFFCKRSDSLMRVVDLLNSFNRFSAEVKGGTLYIR